MEKVVANNKSIHSLVRSIIGTSGIYVVARALSALIPLLLARRFGVSEDMDAFFMAFAIHSFIASSIGSVCEISVVPYLAKASKNDSATLLRFMLLTVPIAVFVITLLVGCCVSITVSRQIAREYWFLAFFPAISVGSGILFGALNTHHYYTLTTIAPGLRALFFVAMFFWLPIDDPRFLGVCFTLAEVLLLLYLLRETFTRGLLSGVGSSAQLSDLFRSTALLSSGFVLLALNPVIDKTFASWVGQGGVSILEYAFSLFYIPANLLTGPLLTILFTRWSRVNDFSAMIKEADRTVFAISLIALACLSGFLTVGKSLLDLLFIGKVAHDQIKQIWLCGSILFGGLMPYVSTSLYSRIALVMGQYRLLAILSAGNAILNLALNFLLYRAMGLPGIVFSTLITYGAVACAIRIYVRKLVPG
jgi:peptidoglycan biosynthesis protein MviN/MurJ (putative lipid II flippase)